MSVISSCNTESQTQGTKKSEERQKIMRKRPRAKIIFLTTCCNLPSGEHDRLEGRWRRRQRKSSGRGSSILEPSHHAVTHCPRVWSQVFQPTMFYFVLFNIYLFCLCWVSIAVHRLSLVAESGCYSLGWCACGLLIAGASLMEHRLQSAQASAVAAPGLQRVASVAVAPGLVVSRHVGSAQIRDRTGVP